MSTDTTADYRYLSALMRSIIELAEQQTVVSYADILQRHYGFQTTRCRNGRELFKVLPFERPRLHAARAAICKAINRLEAKRLITRVHESGAYYCVKLAD
ncbi:MAG: hypothetical protein RBS57_06900 [Desulforhabdus sp.]|jgi:hypothetical protein|nr:hypothetical protein [Desulforhabdus sp.]